jgi:hypothetical protein
MRGRLLRSSLGIAVAALAALLAAAPVAAECTFVPPWPRLTEAIPSARVIVVGEVVDAFDPSELDLPPGQAPRDVALRVMEVLRGDARTGDLLDVQYLMPNWPWAPLHDRSGQAHPSCRGLAARPGEVIALAFDALHPGGPMRRGSDTWFQPPTRYNAVAVVDGRFTSDRERVTLDQLRALAALPATDVEAAAGGPAWPSDLAVVVAAGLGLIAITVRVREASR